MARILVIDDEQPVCTLLRAALESAGYDVVDAQDGRTGLELYRQQPSDLIITDILMPELNGLDTILELIREFLNVKVIAMSGVPQRRNGGLRTAKLLGARQTFQKPLEMRVLLDAVRYELAQ